MTVAAAAARKSRQAKAEGPRPPDLAGIELSRKTPVSPLIERTDVAGFFHLPLERLRPSPLNPRKHFDPDGLAELAATLKSEGVLQPLVVRPKSAGDEIARTGVMKQLLQEAARGLYEIVAGERRYRAAQLAGLKKVPCVVRELDDQAALRVMVIENEQRADVTPLEKAAGYQALLDRGLKVEDLAAEVGKSVGTIRGLLDLLKLPAKARQAVADGTLPQSTAQVIGRMGNDKLREEFAKEVLAGHHYHGVQEPLTYREAKDLAHRRYMVELKQAPFSPAEASLLPSAGSCTACPKRTGNRPDLYPDSRADVCTDPACFQEKVKAHEARLVQLHKDGGRVVLSRKESEKLFDQYDSGHLQRDAPYVDLAGNYYNHAGGAGAHKLWGKSYERLIGKHVAQDVVLAYDRQGRLHRLVPQAVATAALRQHHGASDRQGGQSEADARYRREQAQHREQQAQEKEVARRMMGQAALEAHCIATRCLPIANVDNALTKLLRVLLHHLVHCSWEDVCHQIVERRGIAKQKGVSKSDLVQEQLAKSSSADLVGLLAELVAGRKALFGYDDAEGKKFWAHFSIDRKAIQAQLEQDRKASKPQGKTAANRRSRAAREIHAAATKQPAGEAGDGEDDDDDDGSADARQCRNCGATAEDLAFAANADGSPATFVAPDLCSECAPGDSEDWDWGTAPHPDVLARPVKDLDVPARAWRALEAAGLTTLADLDFRQFTTGKSLDASLADVPGLGPELAQRVRLAMQRLLQEQTSAPPLEE